MVYTPKDRFGEWRLVDRVWNAGELIQESSGRRFNILDVMVASVLTAIRSLLKLFGLFGP